MAQLSNFCQAFILHCTAQPDALDDGATAAKFCDYQPRLSTKPPARYLRYKLMWGMLELKELAHNAHCFEFAQAKIRGKELPAVKGISAFCYVPLIPTSSSFRRGAEASHDARHRPKKVGPSTKVLRNTTGWRLQFRPLSCCVHQVMVAPPTIDVQLFEKQWLCGRAG